MNELISRIFFRIKASGTKRPYFSSGKFLTIQFLTNENSQSPGFHLSSTSARKGKWLWIFKNDLKFLTNFKFLGKTCTYEKLKVPVLLSDHDTHHPHTSTLTYIESPNFGSFGFSREIQ